ncbi:FAD-dependent oxidoreductase [Kutzneria sp. NPDC051319]|uniref:FAD-binding oxidoreductase n=1 Tax=Kutzneria sp. NPDC051319 TaxID=3155047 RepID=UPI0034132391
MLNRRSLLRTGGGIALAAAAGGSLASAAFGAVSAADWLKLRSQLTGTLVLPADANYGLAKQLQITEYDSVNPQGIAYCATAFDVAKCIKFAQYNGIPTRIRSGGHNHSGWSTSSGLVIDVSSFNQATVTGSTVHLGPGAESVDAIAKLKPYNKQVVGGTCPTVCQGGFLSGGGIGWQTRKFGAGCDRVVSITAVLADGRTVHCSPTREPELFWAMRGGGGNNFGVVIDFEVAPINAPTMTNWDTMWSWDRAPEVFAAWQEWTATGSDNIGSSLVVLPPAHSGGPTPLILVAGVYLGPQAELTATLNDLVSQIGAQPVSRTSSEGVYADMMHSRYCGEMTQDQCQRVGHAPDALLPRTPYQRQAYQLFNRSLTGSEITRMFDAWGQDDSLPQRYIQCIALGGALKRHGRSDNAFVHRDAEFLLGFQLGLDNPNPPAADAAAALDWTNRGSDLLDPISGGAYINFPSSRRDSDWGRANYGENYPRLLAAKAQYDPTNFFNNPGSIGS